MRRQVLILLAFAALAAPAAADPVSLPFRAAPGDAWSFARYQAFATVRQDTTSTQTSNATGTLKVIARAGDGYLMEWQTDSVTGDAPPVEGVYTAALKGRAIRYRADANGVPLELINPAGVMDALAQSTIAAGVSAGNPELADARKALAGMAPAQLARHVLADAARIAACQGLTLEPGKTSTRPGFAPQAPNTLPVRIEIAATLVEIGDAGRAQIRIEETPNRQDLAASLVASTRSRLKPGQAMAPDAEENAAKVEQSTVLTCFVDRATGVAQSTSVNYLADTRNELAGKIREVRRIDLSRLP